MELENEYEIYLGHRPRIGIFKKFKQKAGYVSIDCTHLGAGKYISPEYIGPVYDYENNECNSLANFRQFIKVFPYMGHLDGNIITPVWRRWKLAGFKSYKKNFYLGNKFAFNGTILDHYEENNLFEEKYRNHINKQTLTDLIGDNKKLLLLDFFIDDGEPVLYTPELHEQKKKDKNIFLSHTYILAKIISETKDTNTVVWDIDF